MNGIELAYWFVVLGIICVCCGYLSAVAARSFKLDTEAQSRALDLGTLSYTDANTYHRKPNPVPGSNGHRDFHRDPGSVDSNPRPRTVHRHDLGNRPGLAPAVGDPHNPDEEAMK